ncbi:Severin [Fasciolopsis buskii]|uniref:Severin n=1 Tax=Fasciolopsis buskii TaxID=27845 RepID=A0A8E0RKX7_9TREM|nr:Severin [Fasciolopsis buski]
MTELFTDELSWKDTNLALFGSDLEKQVKKDAAMTEEAWMPVLRVRAPQLLVWRIENFRLKPVNPNDYGQFYNGDSYIVLNVYEKEKKLLYDVHFWIGKSSTQDEYGTAAYKTVELDTLLDGACVQHREVEGHESNLFKSYFPNLRILNGGIESGFRHVTPNEYQPRLLHFCLQDRKLVVMQEVDLSANSLKSDDVFILDLGSSAYQWNGRNSNKEERYSAAQFMSQLQHERLGKCKGYVLDEDNVEDHDVFLRVLPDVPIKRSQKYIDKTKCVYRLSDETGELKFELIASNSAPKRQLHDDDVYFIDTGSQLFVYIGGRCSMAEKQNAMSYAHRYLQQTTHPLVPITVLRDDQYSEELEEAWDPDRTKYYLDH